MRERSEQRPGHKQRLQIWLRRRLETLSGKAALLVSAALILTLAGSTIVHVVFRLTPSYFDAVWWSLDHLLDPGSLGDDDDWRLRILGLVLVFAGLIVLAGILFALLTEVVDRSLERLAGVDLPIHTRDHLLLVGWDDGLPDALRALDFLRPRLLAGAALPFREVVVLAPEKLRERRAQMLGLLRETIPWGNPQVVIGDLGLPATYELGAADAAFAIVVGGAAQAGGSEAAADAGAVQAAATLARYLASGAEPPDRTPRVSVIAYAGEHADAIEAIVPAHFDTLVVDRVVAEMLAMELTAPPWGAALRGLLLNVAGARIHLIHDASLTGETFGDLAWRFPTAVPIGLARPTATEPVVTIAPPASTLVERDHAAVVLDENQPTPCPARRPAPPACSWPFDPTDSAPARGRTILVVGFNHRIVALLRELAGMPSVRFHVIVLSQLPEGIRRRALPRWVREALVIDDLEDAPHDPVTLDRTIAASQPDAIIVSDDWLPRHDGVPDADAVFSYLAVRRIVCDRIPVLAVAASSTYADLLRQRDGANLPGIYDMIGGTLAWTLLRADIIPALNALFDPRRVTLRARPGPDLSGLPARFDTLYRATLRHGAVLAGIVRPDGTSWLAPPPETLVPPNTELLLISATPSATPGSPARSPARADPFSDTGARPR